MTVIRRAIEIMHMCTSGRQGSVMGTSWAAFKQPSNKGELSERGKEENLSRKEENLSRKEENRDVQQ